MLRKMGGIYMTNKLEALITKWRDLGDYDAAERLEALVAEMCDVALMNCADESICAVHLSHEPTETGVRLIAGKFPVAKKAESD